MGIQEHEEGEQIRWASGALVAVERKGHAKPEQADVQPQSTSLPGVLMHVWLTLLPRC